MILPYREATPNIHPDAFIEQTALVIGDVEIGKDSSVWFYCVVRGDVNYIRIGERTNIQDLSLVHVTHDDWPTFIGSETTIGHRAVIHGGRIGDYSLIGMGAVVLDGALIGDHCIVGAGALVPPGMKVPNRSLVMGVPAKHIRTINESDAGMINSPLNEYLKLTGYYHDRKSPDPFRTTE